MMKYAIQVIMRFEKKEDREKVKKDLMKVMKKQYTKDDSCITTHRCFHDESVKKPCEIEEIIKVK